MFFIPTDYDCVHQDHSYKGNFSFIYIPQPLFHTVHMAELKFKPHQHHQKWPSSLQSKQYQGLMLLCWFMERTSFSEPAKLGQDNFLYYFELLTYTKEWLSLPLKWNRTNFLKQFFGCFKTFFTAVSFFVFLRMSRIFHRRKLSAEKH